MKFYFTHDAYFQKIDDLGNLILSLGIYEEN